MKAEGSQCEVLLTPIVAASAALHHYESLQHHEMSGMRIPGRPMPRIPCASLIITGALQCTILHPYLWKQWHSAILVTERRADSQGCQQLNCGLAGVDRDG